MNSWFARWTATFVLALSILTFATSLASAQTFTRQGKFDDVKFELTNAIVGKGLVIDYTGKIGEMLARTGADVGSTKPIYKQAEYVAFCSAKLSRAMMEAEPSHIAWCPYVIFVYELVNRPGEIVVGYRRLPTSDRPASKKALADVNALLDGIARAAIK